MTAMAMATVMAMAMAMATVTARATANLGGLPPDQICSDAAMAASLPGIYRAWISSANASPASSWNTDGVYVLRQGGTVAYSWADLIDDQLESPINRTEFGEMLQSSPACNNAVPFAVWTGTMADGTNGDPNCADWSSNMDSATGRVGNAGATDAAWSASDCTPSCATALPIYCVQQ